MYREHTPAVTQEGTLKSEVRSVEPLFGPTRMVDPNRLRDACLIIFI